MYSSDPLLNMAEEIRFKLFGKPTTHQEWANSFNIRGDILRILKQQQLSQ